MNSNQKYVGHASIIFVNIILGVHIPVSKALLGEWMTPVGYMFSRIAFAAAIFWLFSLFSPKEKIEWKDLILVAIAGLFGFTVSQFLFATALRFSSPVTLSLIVSLSPVVVMLLAALFLNEKITRNKVFGVVLAIAGAFLLILNAGGNGSGSSAFTGIILSFLSIVTYAVYIIIFRKVSGKYSPVTLMKWMFLSNLIFMLPFSIGEMGNQVIFSSRTSLNGILLLSYVLVFSTAVSYLLMPVGLKRLRATTVSIYMNLQPVTASAVALLIGQDSFNWYQPAALVLVISGAFLATKTSGKKEILKDYHQKKRYQLSHLHIPSFKYIYNKLK